MEEDDDNDISKFITNKRPTLLSMRAGLRLQHLAPDCKAISLILGRNNILQEQDQDVYGTYAVHCTKR